jgi:N-acetyl-anhydromuramyl-L-alanine amidase AmpD
MQRWRKPIQRLGLATISVLLVVAAIKWIHFIGRQSAQPDSSKTAELSARLASTAMANALERQLMGLRRLYTTAEKSSVEQLFALEDAATEGGLTSTLQSLQDPSQYRIEADPTNYGDRLSKDIKGEHLHNRLLIVLHETTSAASGAVNTALTPHPRNEDQISYHAIIRQDGKILYLVDPLKRAYGAGDSLFKGRSGSETVQTNKNLKSSVNNFAYHISLETPSDGYHDQSAHSGYSSAQYSSLAWLIAQSGVEGGRVTTHAAVDRSGERQDPRSFDMSWLQQDLALRTVDASLEMPQTR